MECRRHLKKFFNPIIEARKEESLLRKHEKPLRKDENHSRNFKIGASSEPQPDFAKIVRTRDMEPREASTPARGNTAYNKMDLEFFRLLFAFETLSASVSSSVSVSESVSSSASVSESVSLSVAQEPTLVPTFRQPLAPTVGIGGTRNLERN